MLFLCSHQVWQTSAWYQSGNACMSGNVLDVTGTQALECWSHIQKASMNTRTKGICKQVLTNPKTDD